MTSPNYQNAPQNPQPWQPHPAQQNHMQPQGVHYQAPAAQSGSRGVSTAGGIFAGAGCCAGAGCGTVALVVIVFLVIVAMIGGITKAALDSSTPTQPTTQQTQLYRMGDRPGWQKLEDTASRIYNKYQPMVKDGSIYTVIPGGKSVGKEYVEEFEFQLVDLHAAMRFTPPDQISTDPVELDNTITYLQSQWDTLESNLLSAKPFEVTYTLVERDGTTQKFDGKPGEHVPSKDQKAQDPYAVAQDIQPDPNDPSAYVEQGDAVASAFGMRVNHSDADLSNYCSRKSLDAKIVPVATFCSAKPEIVWVPANKGGPYPDYYEDPRYVDTIKHEIAHAIIFQKCGTTAPPITGAYGRYEAVTNSFAVRYLGADYDRLNNNSDAGAKYYTMNSESDAAADKIAEGVCS